MRLLLKLSAAVVLAVMLQCTSVRLIGLLDEAQFAARMIYAEATGVAPDSPELLDAAEGLLDRHYARLMHDPRRPVFESAFAWWQPTGPRTANHAACQDITGRDVDAAADSS